jgi:succinoglycan biosynthesis transport protein ExoP
MLYALPKDSYRRSEREAAPPQWSLYTLWSVVKWRSSGIIWAIISCLGIAVAYLAITPPTYKATAVVVTDTKRVPPQPNEFTPDTTVDMAVVETQLEAIRSEKLALAVIDKLSLWKIPEFSGARSGLLSWATGLLHGFRAGSGPSPKVDDAERKRQTALDRFRRGLQVERVGRSYVTDITFESRDPETAAKIANALADGYISDQLNAKQQTLQRSNDWMQAHIGELRDQAEAATKAVDAFTMNNPSNIDADGRLKSEIEFNAVSAELAKARSQSAAAGGADVAALEKRLADLSRRVADEKSKLEKLRDMRARAESSRAAYQTAVDRFNQSLQLQQQSVPATEARILTEATPPHDRSSPKLALVLMLALVGGGTLGVTGAFGREFLQNLVRSPRRLETELGVKAISAVPNVPQRRLLGLRRSHTPLMLIDPAVRAKASFSLADEAVRSLKIAIDHYCRDKSRVIGITSAGSAEGKTTLAFNLALLAAQCGRRALLIDANLRNRRLSSLLAPDQTEGLEALVCQNADFSLCTKSWEGTFVFLGETSGAVKHHPADILGSAVMAAHLKKASEDFDYVILDLPPARGCSEVHAIASLTDGFVFAAEWGKTSVQDIERAVANSDLIAQRLIGVALTKVPDGEHLAA